MESNSIQQPDPGPELDFLSGGGEAGEIMRALDWDATPLGSPHRWPQSLRSALSICLGASFPIAIYWGRDLALLYNDAWSPIPGRKHPSSMGRAGREVWPEIWATIGPMFNDVMATGVATRSRDSLLAMHRHGFTEECYFDYTFSPIRDEAGKVGGIFNAVVETTFRVIGERRTRVLRELTDSLADAHSVAEVCARTGDALRNAALDLPFFLLYVSAGESTGADVSHLLALGASAGIATGGEIPHRAPDAEVSGLISPIATTSAAALQAVPLPQHIAARVTGAPWPEPCEQGCTLPLGADGGGFFIGGISPRLAFDGQYQEFFGRIAGVIASAIGRAQALALERHRVEAIAAIDRAKTAFFSNVSHEFRTPITLILGPVEQAMARPGLSADVREGLGFAHRNALRLSKLVNSLLDFSRIEAGRVQASYVATDLAAITRDLASTFRSAMERAGLQYHIDCEPLSRPVFIDRDMWEKIVLNLLSNAFKFTLEGGITVRLREREQAAELEVSDTGVGIAPEELPRLFERFHRIENTRARTHEGSGIGLSLVEELVQLQGGRIAVQSAPGEGTRFTITLPFGDAHLPAERIGESATLSSTATSADAYVEEALRWLPRDGRAPVPASDLSGIIERPADARLTAPSATRGAHILLADDNADMRDYVQRLLESDYRVTAVEDGVAALAEVRRSLPDLVLSDVMMPRLDGFGLLKALRADPWSASTPVILLSARAGEEATIEGLAAGADDYLIKPFSARELQARVSAALALARVRAEAARRIEDSERQYRALVTASSDVVYRMNADWSEMRHLQGREFIADTFEPNRTWMDAYIPADDQAMVQAAIRQAIDTRGHFELTHRVLRTDGTLGWTFSRAVPIFDAHGELQEWFGMASDITAQKTLEHSLREADRQKDEFLAMLAHELRNPLAPIRTASELLTRLVADPQARGVIDIVRRQALHLSRLVDDLLDVSRITQRRIVLQRQAAEVSEIIRQAIETVEPVIRERGHRLHFRASYPALYVDGDVARLVQSLVNLLTNAAKYTDAGGEIHVDSRAEGGEAVITVSDNGVGIPPTLLPRIFDIFVQSDRTLDRAQGGLGIGLSVVRQLVEMHGGRVAAHSDGAGKGASFTVRLPLVSAPASAGTLAGPATLATRRVLVVDDNADAADTLAMTLRMEGHDAQAVYSGRDALARFDQLRPHLVLLDIGLPGMTSYEVARQIRAMPEGATTRIIALTGYGQAEDRARAVAEGFDDHLVKPANLDAILAVLARYSQSSP